MNEQNIKIHIESIGNDGDGIGKDETGKNWYIPATLPDENVEARFITPRGKGVAGKSVNIENKSINRQIELCKHAQKCGGCSLLHMKDDLYKSWQIEMVQNVLSRNNIDVPVKLEFQTKPHTRRRATFHIKHENNGVNVGFYKQYSQTIEPIDDCLVLDKKLTKSALQLQELFGFILKPRKQAEAAVTLCDNGLDVLLKFPKKLKTSQLKVLNSYVDKGYFVRLSVQEAKEETRILWQTEEPFVNFGNTAVPVAIGGFLQATKSGENSIVKTVINAIEKNDNILEFFAGNGTITLPLLEHGKNVTAVELNSDSLRMLRQGAKEYESKLSVVEKNLFTEVYSSTELNNYDCVVLDPPRAGATQQVKAISKSQIKKVVMVSCNIKTFAQDADVLINAGYSLNEVLVIDQFLWTPHVEAVGAFVKS